MLQSITSFKNGQQGSFCESFHHRTTVPWGERCVVHGLHGFLNHLGQRQRIEIARIEMFTHLLNVESRDRFEGRARNLSLIHI